MVLIEFTLSKRHRLPFHLPKKTEACQGRKKTFTAQRIAVVLRPLPVSEAFRDESEIAK